MYVTCALTTEPSKLLSFSFRYATELIERSGVIGPELAGQLDIDAV